MTNVDRLTLSWRATVHSLTQMVLEEMNSRKLIGRDGHGICGLQLLPMQNV